MFLEGVGAADDPASAGRQMPSHWSSKKLNIFTTSSPTGSECLPGVGAAEAGRYLLRPEAADFREAASAAADDEVVVVTIGDGSTSEGEFWEALSSACGKKLPVLFVVEDNGYAISVPVEVNTPGGSISKLVRSFPGLFVAEIDGCDFLGRTTPSAGRSPTPASGRARPSSTRTSSAPTRIPSPTTNGSTAPRPSGTGDAERDPVTTMARWLVEEGVLTEEDACRR